MNDYPDDWKQIAERVKTEANRCCVRCGHHHDRKTWHVLTVHHMDGDKANCAWYNLLALCQRCHLSFQGRVDPNQPYIFEHSPWFKIFACGFYAKKYLKQDLTRAEALARMDELLKLECLCT